MVKEYVYIVRLYHDQGGWEPWEETKSVHKTEEQAEQALEKYKKEWENDKNEWVVERWDVINS